MKVLSVEWIDLANELVEMRKAAMRPVTFPVTLSSASSDLPVLPVPRGIRVMEGMSRQAVNQTVEQEDDFDENPAALGAQVNQMQTQGTLCRRSIGASSGRKPSETSIGAMPDFFKQYSPVKIPGEPPTSPRLTIGEQSAPAWSPGDKPLISKEVEPIGSDQSAAVKVPRERSASVINPSERSEFIRSIPVEFHSDLIEQPNDGLERSIHPPLGSSTNPLRMVLGEEKGRLMTCTQAGDGSRNMGPAGDLTRPGEQNGVNVLIPVSADAIGGMVNRVLSAQTREAPTQSLVTEMNPSLPHPNTIHIVTPRSECKRSGDDTSIHIVTIY